MKKILICIIIILATLFVTSVAAATFPFNGTTFDSLGTRLNGTNITITLKDANWADLGTNSSLANASGWFSVNVSADASYFYSVSIKHTNTTLNYIDYVGQSLPALPYAELVTLADVNYYLKESATINITVMNSSASFTSFAAQVKDTKLGWPVQTCSSLTTLNYVCNVPKDRNYSIMAYPQSGGTENFVPVSFNWNNFTGATETYVIADNSGTTNYSRYNVTTRTLHKSFNVTESMARLEAYINTSNVDTISGWDNITIVPFVSEPGNMLFMSAGTLPYNTSAWVSSTDVYNYTTGISQMTGWANISLPYAAAETVGYILFMTGHNGTDYYGAYRNLTVNSANHRINFTVYGLLGDSTNISMSDGGGAAGSSIYVNTSRQTFSLVNATDNQTLSGINAHIETILDYTNYQMGFELTFMNDITAGHAMYSLPMINVTGYKEINVYSMGNFAPKRMSTKTAAQIQSNSNISMKAFNPGDIDSAIGASGITITLLRSNSSCDLPNAPSVCSLTSSTMDSFTPFSTVIGGGALSFRMEMDNVIVHYVNVDLFASGPPDALFDDDDTSAESTDDGFTKALRFGSAGPTIYDYILIAMPYTVGSSSQTGLDETSDVNISIPFLYDEEWNVIWNTSANGTTGNDLAANFSHYNTYSAQWQTLMGNVTCATNQNSSFFNSTNPCYIDSSGDRIWIRLPHFSGTGPSVTGSVVTADTSSDSSSSSSGGSGGSSGGAAATTTTEEEEEVVEQEITGQVVIEEEVTEAEETPEEEIEEQIAYAAEESSSRWWLWTGIGVVILGILGGAIFFFWKKP